MGRLAAVLLALFALCSEPLAAGLSVGQVSLDLSQYATKDQLPQQCSQAPIPDTLMGSPGSQACFTPRDASRPTAVQAATVLTDATGLWSLTFNRSFSTSAVVLPIPVNSGNLPVLCNVTSRSQTAASGRCWQSALTTLPGVATSLLGLVVSPFTTAASGISVMVIAREPTQ